MGVDDVDILVTNDLCDLFCRQGIDAAAHSGLENILPGQAVKLGDDLGARTYNGKNVMPASHQTIREVGNMPLAAADIACRTDLEDPHQEDSIVCCVLVRV